MELTMFPVKTMTGHGSHNQPAGTWSDDSSLTFCLAEELLQGYDLHAIGQSFRRWYSQSHWTAHNEVFDIGNSTHEAIERLGVKGMAADLAGGMSEYDNGNGSLMRILPLALYTIDKPLTEGYAIAKAVSSITHAHFRSVMCCSLYLEFAHELIKDASAKSAHKTMIKTAKSFFDQNDFNPKELERFNRVLSPDFAKINKEDIQGSGYVLHSLESSIWCLLNSVDYRTAVLKAVNLGEDTDTTGAITGDLAGLLYGYETIPEDWIITLARKDDIMMLGDKLSQKFAHLPIK